MTEIRVPTLGESVTEATIGRWFKKAGDAVAVDEPLVELETDKVTIEVPAPSAGVLGEISAKDGETVAVGALLGQIMEGAAGAAAKPNHTKFVISKVIINMLQRKDLHCNPNAGKVVLKACSFGSRC